MNKWLAQEGVCSRREAEGLIEAGAVSINGETVTEPGRKIAPGEVLTLGAKGAKALDTKLTVLLNKPVGYVSGTPEDEQVPAVRLLTKAALQGASDVIPGRQHKLAPIGRLDQDSHGLLILSEDGVVAKAVIGPDSNMTKEYLVRVRGEATDHVLSRLRHGLSLDGRRLKVAEVTREPDGRLRFILREGRNRQIRRMCDLVGLRVTDLQRVRVGPVELGDLGEGKWRPVSEAERAALIAAGAAPRPRTPKPGPVHPSRGGPERSGPGPRRGSPPKPGR